MPNWFLSSRFGLAVLFLNGVAPPVEHGPCRYTQLSPPSQSNWKIEIGDVDQIRIHLGASHSTLIGQPLWTAEGVSGLRAERPLDSPMSWSEIVRIDKPEGTRGGFGAALGMGVGLVAAIIAGVICAQGHDSDGQEFEATCGETFLTAALIAVPIGAVAGGII